MQVVDEIKSKVNELSDEELKQIELIIKKEKTQRQIDEILEAAKIAKKEHQEGKTEFASTPEEIILWFKKTLNDED